MSPPDLHRVSGTAVRLTSTATQDLEVIFGSFLGGPPIASLDTLTNDLTTINDATGLSSLVSDLNNLLNPSGLGNELTSLLGSLTGATDTSGMQNIPYNLFADVLNIPYYESLASQEYGFALGPPGSTGGVPGWIPPGATVANGGVDPSTDQYTLGGTGSYWYESVGNT
ncbi:MAG: hypothetical protein ACRDTN_11785, partial [Mycobacterium sp.]